MASLCLVACLGLFFTSPCNVLGLPTCDPVPALCFARLRQVVAHWPAAFLGTRGKLALQSLVFSVASHHFLSPPLPICLFTLGVSKIWCGSISRCRVEWKSARFPTWKPTKAWFKQFSGYRIWKYLWNDLSSGRAFTCFWNLSDNFYLDLHVIGANVEYSKYDFLLERWGYPWVKFLVPAVSVWLPETAEWRLPREVGFVGVDQVQGVLAFLFFSIFFVQTEIRSLQNCMLREIPNHWIH